jgi:hypothetical protein
MVPSVFSLMSSTPAISFECDVTLNFPSTEKVPGMFATIVIVLPSHFTGGDAHLLHGGKRLVYASSLNSLNATSVLAWYTDVTHEIKPITSGYRLALSYNLIHTTDSLRPSLTMEKAAADRLRHTFLSWKQNVDLAAPEKLLYLLEHEYTQASLSASAMKGKDAHVLSLLSGLADEVGFNLGLASVEHTVIGGAEGDVWDGMNVTMDEAREWSTKIDCFVDLDGSELRAFDDFDAETEAIPNELTRTIEEGEYDEQDYEGYTGNVSCKHRITWQVLTR